MKPVDQTLFGILDGNCLQACFASILELPLDDVPVLNLNKQLEPIWFASLMHFVRQHGHALLYLNEDLEHLPYGEYIGGGNSPRGIRHACVFSNRTMVHDPHPSRQGLWLKSSSYHRVDSYYFLFELRKVF